MAQKDEANQPMAAGRGMPDNVTLEHDIPPDDLMLFVKGAYVHIPRVTIIYMRGEDNYTTFFLQKDRKIVVARTLKEFELKLSASGFLRIHKSYIINPSFLRGLVKKGGIFARMDNGELLPVARRRAPVVLAQLSDAQINQ
jgi:two-component system, LytTR family, response regulator